MANKNYKPIKCIYKIVSPSGKVYIGQTSNLQKRMSRYRTNSCKSQKMLYNSLVKYGFDNHLINVVYLCDNDEILNEVEIFFINKYNSFKNGLNLTSGGRSKWVMSDDVKEILRIKSTGNKNRLGHTNKWGRHTDEAKKLMSEIIKERFIKNGGSHWKGRNQTKEHSKKIAEAKFKPVIKFDLDGNFICEYESLTMASKDNEINLSNLSRCCRNKRATCGGFRWSFK